MSKMKHLLETVDNNVYSPRLPSGLRVGYFAEKENEKMNEEAACAEYYEEHERTLKPPVPQIEYLEADFSVFDSVVIPPPAVFPPRGEIVDSIDASIDDEDFYLDYTFEGAKSIANLLKRFILPGRVLYDNAAPPALKWYFFTAEGWENDDGGDSGKVLNYIEIARQVYIKKAIKVYERVKELYREKKIAEDAGNKDIAESIEQEISGWEDRRDKYRDYIKKIFVFDHSINSILRHVRAGENAAGTDESVVFRGKWDDRVQSGGDCLLPLKNGIFDLRRKIFRRYTPRDYLLRRGGLEFDPRARCPLWEKTLSEIFLGDTDVVSWLHRFFGYVITRQPSESIAVFFHGERGRNGKSLIANTLLRVLGDLATSIPAQTLLADAKQSRNSATPDSMLMRGRALCVLSEFDEYAKLNSAFLKSLTGGDEIQGRDLYAPKIEKFYPTHTFIILTNYRPAADAADEALWRRIVLIPFNAVYCKDPAPEKNEFPLDNQLEKKLQGEAQGILNWLILGAIKYLEDGKSLGGLPDSISRATEEYRAGEDRIQVFLDDCCEPDATEADTVRSSELYSVFYRWCKNVAKQTKIPSDKTFKERLSKKGVVFHRGKQRVYKKIKLIPKAELDKLIGDVATSIVGS